MLYTGVCLENVLKFSITQRLSGSFALTVLGAKCKFSLVVGENKNIFYQYLKETLGVNYVPQPQLSKAPSSEHHIVWQRPNQNPKVIFFNTDADTHIQNAELEEMFTKIVQAIGFKREEVWFCDSDGRSFMDFLNWLKNQHQFSAPLVVMKKDPEILNHIQNAGSFDWVECFSLQMMKDKANLKKPTWEVLKILKEKIG